MQGFTSLRIGRKWSERIFASSMVLPSIIILAVLFVYPLFLSVKISFYKVHTILGGAKFVGLANYIAILKDPEFWDALNRSLIWTVSVLVAQLILGILIALLLNEELVGRTIARGLIMFPWLVPAVVAAIIWRYMFNPLLGVANYILVDVLNLIKQPIMWLASPKMALVAIIIVGIWKWLPFMVLMFLARLQTISLDLYDAARVDGANAWQEFRYVTLPWLSPAIIVALLLRSIWLFNHFDLVYLLGYGGPVKSTTTVPLLVRDAVFADMQMGKASALSMIMTIIMVITAVIYFYYYGKAEEELRN
jgi:multiple sugar transport system permease protein